MTGETQETSSADESAAEEWAGRFGFEGQGAIGAGKRLAMDWSPWMGDWFVSSSPRNCNSHAEGPWDQWVDLALAILSDPMTAIVRPDVHSPELAAKRKRLYDGADRYLTAVELRQRFERKEPKRPGEGE